MSRRARVRRQLPMDIVAANSLCFALYEEHKQAIARDVCRDIRTADPDLNTDVPRIFCVIDEVTDGNWGVENQIVRAVESVDLLSVTDERIRSAAQRQAASSDGVPAAP